MTRGTQFRGYGPASIAASGLVALVVAAAQAWIVRDAGQDALLFLGVWVATAAASVALTAFETIARARRVHSGLASQMIHSAVEQFLPATVVGVLLTGVLLLAAPQDLWMLPGLVAVDIQSRRVCLVPISATPDVQRRGLVSPCGLACLMIESGPRTLSPWEMGIPFG